MKIVPVKSSRDLLDSERPKVTHPQHSQEDLHQSPSKSKIANHQNDRFATTSIKKGFFAPDDDPINSSIINVRKSSAGNVQQLGVNFSTIFKKGSQRLESVPHEKEDEDEMEIELSLSPYRLKLKNKIKYEEIVHHHTFNKECIPVNQVLHGSLFKVGSLFPRSDLYFSEGLKFLISCKKNSCCFGSTFYLSSSRDSSPEQSLGTLKSNFSGSEYTLYDEEDNIIANIFYQSQLSCEQKPRMIEVYILSPSTQYSQLEGINGQKNLKQLYQIPKNFNNGKIIKYINKKPIWVEQKEIWALDFGGRKFMSSVRNLILLDEQKNQELFVMGKTHPEVFSIEGHYPLSPRLMMGILCSSFDFKWVSQ